MVLASFHLARHRPGRALAVMGGLPRRARALRSTPGLRFARQLGTGRGSGMGLGADLRRWAAFCVWEDEAALDAFLLLGRSPVARAWTEDAEESWSVRLRPLSGHGTWGGRSPLPELRRHPAPVDGPVAVLTRARVRVRSWPAFHRAGPAVGDALHAADGVLAAVGIGEAPLGLQATFSLWRSAGDLEAFAYAAGATHLDAVQRTRREGWFAEELFARFEPYGSTGTWSGSDPLATAAGRRAGGNGS